MANRTLFTYHRVTELSSGNRHVGVRGYSRVTVLPGPSLTSISCSAPRGVWDCDLPLGGQKEAPPFYLLLSENVFLHKRVKWQKKLWMGEWIPCFIWAMASFEWPVWTSVKFWGIREVLRGRWRPFSAAALVGSPGSRNLTVRLWVFLLVRAQPW